jgi:hypothetical protein
MSVVPIADRAGPWGRRPRGGAGLALALLAAGLLAPAGAGLAAGTPAADQATPLDQLSATIGELRLSLSAMRRDLEAVPAPQAGAPPALDALCGTSPTEPADEREVARLRTERATLEGRIAELEKVIKRLRTSEVVGALVERSPASPIETAAAAELDAGPRRAPMLKVAAAGQTSEAGAPAAADGEAGLQLRAELALAQLKIAELTDKLQSTRAGQAALEAELGSLRSLTDAKIKRFMGWR